MPRFSKTRADRIQDSEDLRRVLALPRRRLDLDEGERLSDELTPLLARSDRVRLRPVQALALSEIHRYRGAYIDIAVGGGKTLISWLAAYVLDAKRPVLVIPAALVDKTMREFAAIARDWVSPSPPPRVITYQALTQESAVDLPSRLQPDLWILDEVHRLRAQDRSGAKRIGRDVDEREPDVICMTGTGMRHQISDFSHHLIWALKEGAPIPLVHAELERWSAVIDDRIIGARPDPGALYEIGGHDLASCREAFADRINETPGVIILDDTDCDQNLIVSLVRAPSDPTLDAAFETFRLEYVTPDGWPMSDALSIYRHESELGCGLYYKWDPRPPEEWLIARQGVCALIRHQIQITARTGHPLDTDAAVMRAFPEHPAVLDWRRIKPTFTPNSVPVWLSSSVVQYAAAWAKRGPGLIWTQHSAFGDTLGRVSGLSYYGAGGFDAAGRSIEQADPAKAAVLSIQANMTGRNLQAWNRNLIIGLPQSALYVEQLLGRTHRYGQRRVVTAEIMVTSGGTLRAFEAALSEAMHVERIKRKKQKILRADIEMSDAIEYNGSEALRWA